MGYGQKSAIGISFQNSWDTLNTDSMHWISHNTDGVALEIEQLVSEANRGIFDEGEVYEGPKQITGDLECDIKPLTLGAFLTAALDVASTTAVDSVYQHIFEPAKSDFDEVSAQKPFTYQQDLDTGSAQLFYNCVGSALELSISNGELLMAKLSVIGAGFSQQAPLTPSYPTGKKWTWDQTSVSIGGSGTAKLSELTVTVDNAVEAGHTLSGSKFPSRIKRSGFRMTSISGTIKFQDQDEYQAFLNQSERELDVTLTGPTEIASGYYDTLRIQTPLLRHGEFKPNAGGPGEIEVGFTAKGVYSTESATAIKMTLTNTQAAY